jgi:uncharacterized protein (TIGR01244 family)
MQSKAITEEFTVAAQIGPEDVPAIKAQGFAAILCNRPDGEAADQPPYAAIEAAARAEGLAVAYAPVISGQITMEDVTAFREAVAALPGRSSPIAARARAVSICGCWHRGPEGRGSAPADHGQPRGSRYLEEQCAVGPGRELRES